MITESKIDISKPWYLGNNREENLRIVQPSWDKPFFLTTKKSYAEKYADYGVWKVELKNEVNSSVCNFDNDSDCKKLKWPKKLIDLIRKGKHDLNTIAIDLYMIKTGGETYSIDDSEEWQKVADVFQKKYKERNSIASTKNDWSQYDDFSDYRYLFEMWKDIANAGFDGFAHTEFGSKILALFSIKNIDKISANRID